MKLQVSRAVAYCREMKIHCFEGRSTQQHTSMQHRDLMWKLSSTVYDTPLAHALGTLEGTKKVVPTMVFFL